MANGIITINESEYNAILRQVVAVIEDSKATIAKNINVSINTTHWKIGMLLHERKLESKHGSGVVNRLSVDLKQIYPEMGVSPRNLWDMKKFYERFKDCDEKLRHAVAVLPWWNTLKLMSKLGENDEAILCTRNGEERLVPRLAVECPEDENARESACTHRQQL